jgi:hypothetical protein
MTGLELDLRGTYRGWRDLVDSLSSNAELSKAFPSPRVVQTLVQSAFQMLDDGVSLRHRYDEAITVRLRVGEGKGALSLSITPDQGGSE